MKIALCLQYPLAVRGGVSVLVETLLENITKYGHEVVLVSPDPPDVLRRSESGRLVCEHISWNAGDELSASARHLAKRIAETGVHVAHFHFGGTYGWGNRFPECSPVTHLSRLEVPCISTVHLVIDLINSYCGPQKPAWFKLGMLPLAWLGKMQQLRHVRFEIAVSQHDLRKLRRWYAPLRSRFVQIYHSRLRDEISSFNFGRRNLVILNVGHLAWRKGQRVLVEAFARIAARHPEWKLQLAGHDSGDGTLEEIRNFEMWPELKGRIELLGERVDALELMGRAAIYVQPSYWEALGLALQEAMFCGCAVIGSTAGGIPELIEKESGQLFAPGSVTQLASILDQLMSDTLLREKLGRAAAASIRNRGMTIETMVRRHIELYESAAGIT